MTIRQYIKNHGWQDETTALGAHRYMTVDIDFLDTNKKEQETQFDIHSYELDELANLFRDFCKENHFPLNQVTSITIVKKAYSLEEL